MARLQPNFAASSAHRPAWPGLLCLLVGLLCAGYAALSYLDARAEAQRWLARQAQKARPAAAPVLTARAEGSTAATASSAAPATAAQTRAMQQLAWPWSDWLRTLEAQSDTSVAWLRLEALGDSRTLRLQGESKTMQDATGFVQRLQQAPWVESAALSSHDAGSTARDGQALQFSVDVRWKLQP